MRVQLTATTEVINALRDGLVSEGLLQDAEVRTGTGVDSDRLAFELGDACTLLGGVVAGLDLLKFAYEILKSTADKKQKKLELTGPAAKVIIDTTGKDPEQVAALIRSALILDA